VACYLEGLTQTQAASRLRLAESTVRGRLARARKLLGQRLTRRGVAPAIALLALENAAEASASFATTVPRLSDAIVRSLARDALRFARSANPANRGVVASTAPALADGVLSTMWFPSLKTFVAAAALAGVGLGITAVAAGALGRRAAETAPAPLPGPDPRPVAEPPSPPPQDPGERRKRSGGRTPKAGSSVAVDKDLAKRTPGPIVRAVPVSKDCMILSYIPDWAHGNVDNLGLANNGGGVRVLIDWPAISAEDAAAPDRRFLVALYSRKTTSNPPAGRIHAFEILYDWPELSSWNRKPRCDPEPFATYKFEPGEGWKLFDVTPLVRDQPKAGRQGHGILLRFLSEDFNGPTWSGYDFVSREGDGEWTSRRPVLLVVKDAKEEE
jgi:hypothetical protein